MTIRFATLADVEIIHRLANEIWWPTYESILSPEQIKFMLEKMYSPDALTNQFNEGISFILAETDKGAIAFASFSDTGLEEQVVKIHKLYVLPAGQGKGLGRLLLEFIESEARQNGASVLQLNVNRENPALNFYRKQGFAVIEEVDIPYFDYVLNDYVLQKQV